MEPINRSVNPIINPVVEAIDETADWVLLERSPGNEIVNPSPSYFDRLITSIGDIFKRPIKTSFDAIPNEVMLTIFTYARGNILSLQRVNRNWRQLANDGQLYKMMIAASAIDKKSWEKYIGDPGNEPKLPDLPLVIFKEIEEGRGSLTFIPKTIRIKRIEEVSEEGVVVRKEIIKQGYINPKNMGELAANPKGGGHKTQYHPEAWREAIEEKRKVEESHWVYIRHESIGRTAFFEKQQELVGAKHHHKVQDCKLARIKDRADVASLNDLIVTAFMEKIRSGKSCFELKGYTLWKGNIWTSERIWIPCDTLIRVKEEIKTTGMHSMRKRICVAFTPLGLHVCDDSEGIGYYRPTEKVVVAAWKSF